MKEFLPDGEFEIAMVKAKSGFLAASELMRLLMTSRLVVPSGAVVAANGDGFEPLQFSKLDTPMLACFTARDRISEFSSIAPYYLEIDGEQLLKRLPAGYGVVVNPGWPVGFDISPQGVSQILADFGAV